MSRPSDGEFVEWVKDDHNVSRVREALRNYPDLIAVKYKVRNVDNVHISTSTNSVDWHDIIISFIIYFYLFISTDSNGKIICYFLPIKQSNIII